MNDIPPVDRDSIKSYMGYEGTREDATVFLARNLLHALHFYHSDHDLADEVLDWAKLLEEVIGLGPNPYE